MLKQFNQFGDVLKTLLSCLCVYGLLCAVASPVVAQPKEAKPAQEKPKEGGKDSSLKSLLGGGSEKDKQTPLYIKSNSLSLDSNIRTFTYSGNVQIDRGALVITADVVVGKYDENNQLQSVICENNVVVTNEQDMRASSNRAVYDLASATIVMTESPELARQGNVLSADKVTVYVNENRSEAEGNVRVKVLKADESGASALSAKQKLISLEKGDALKKDADETESTDKGDESE